MVWHSFPGTTIDLSPREFTRLGELIVEDVKNKKGKIVIKKNGFTYFEGLNEGTFTSSIHLITDPTKGDYVLNVYLNAPRESLEPDKRYACYIELASTDPETKRKADEGLEELLKQAPRHAPVLANRNSLAF